MIDKVNIEQCVICGNCSNVCPVSAISFSNDEKMFLYPSIDMDKCIKCNKCESVCPTLNPLPQNKAFESYAVKHKNKQVRINSSSGGLFSALAQAVITDGGYVCGAAFDDDFYVRHIIVDKLEDIALLRGSKYVQSDLDNCFFEIYKLLSESKTVLFSGCPCQCSALKVYLNQKKYTGNLFIIDFICHGILSRTLFQEYLFDLQSKKKSPVKEFNFRSKQYGWIDSGPTISFESGKRCTWPLYEDTYMQGYFQGLCMRESCYTCQYKNFHSGSDLTMGDFWGAETLIPKFYDNIGVSLCCIQTEKGSRLFNQAKKELEVEAVSLGVLTKYNKGLITPFEKGLKNKDFYQLAEEKGYYSALKSITGISFLERIKRYYRKFKRKIRKYDKKVNFRL